MNCLRCNTQNEEVAKFCKNCGMDMSYTPSIKNTNSKSSDTFLIIYISTFLFIEASDFVFSRMLGLYNIYYFIFILKFLSLILIPLAIKNKTMKIIGIIIAIINIVFQITDFLFRF